MLCSGRKQIEGSSYSVPATGPSLLMSHSLSSVQLPDQTQRNLEASSNPRAPMADVAEVDFISHRVTLEAQTLVPVLVSPEEDVASFVAAWSQLEVLPSSVWSNGNYNS